MRRLINAWRWRNNGQGWDVVERFGLLLLTVMLMTSLSGRALVCALFIFVIGTTLGSGYSLRYIRMSLADLYDDLLAWLEQHRRAAGQPEHAVCGACRQRCVVVRSPLRPARADRLIFGSSLLLAWSSVSGRPLLVVAAGGVVLLLLQLTCTWKRP